MSNNTPIWQNQTLLHLPTLQETQVADLCVIGLGGSGLSATLAALQLGANVVGLDAGIVAGGAAGRNGGFLLAGMAQFYHQAIASWGHDNARTLYQFTCDKLEEIKTQTPDSVRATGSLRVASDAAELEDCQLHLKALQADGFEALAYEGPEGQGLLLPQDAAFQPMHRCQHLAQMALDAGARLFEHSPVVGIDAVSNGHEVRTAHATVKAKHVVVAVDGRLEQLLPELVGRVRSARLQMLATAPTQEVHLPRPVYARWGYEYWQQLPDGRITLGGFRDAFLEDEWTFENTPSDNVQNRLEQFLRGPLGIEAPIQHRWAANVAYTENGLPILQELRPGLWAVGAYNGTGNVVGVLCGEAAARLALGAPSGFAQTLWACA